MDANNMKRNAQKENLPSSNPISDRHLFHVVVPPNFFILVHDTQSPSHAEWDNYLSDLKHLCTKSPSPKAIKTLVYTLGGTPGVGQRYSMNQILKEQDTPVAVVSPIVLPRLTAGVLSVFNKEIRSFAPQNQHAAFDHLELNEEERVTATQTIKRLLNKFEKDSHN